ncbi:hypothetical protein FQN49_006177 [Arthroderma sp. PD_2]|nr:hypothetical protein FQN49_006177 [Arthroderma sp. PD_2]
MHSYFPDMFTPILRALLILNRERETPENTPQKIDADDGEREADIGQTSKDGRDRLMTCAPGVQIPNCPMTFRSRSGSTSHDLIPQFFIYRRDGTKVPLVPLDELPHGLKIGRRNWSNRFWLGYMTPASLSRYPKRGEYKVTIRPGSVLIPKTSSKRSGIVPPGQEQSDTTFKCRRGEGGKTCKGDICGDCETKCDRKPPPRSPPLILKAKEGGRGELGVPPTPPNSFTASPSSIQSIEPKSNGSDVGGPNQDPDNLHLQKGLNKLACQQTLSLHSSGSDPPSLSDCDSAGGSCSSQSAPNVHQKYIRGYNFAATGLSNSMHPMPPSLDKEHEGNDELISRRLTFP